MSLIAFGRISARDAHTQRRQTHTIINLGEALLLGGGQHIIRPEDLGLYAYEPLD